MPTLCNLSGHRPDIRLAHQNANCLCERPSCMDLETYAGHTWLKFPAALAQIQVLFGQHKSSDHRLCTGTRILDLTKMKESDEK